MKSALFLLAFPLLAQPTITAVTVNAISHSTAQVTATSSLSVAYVRINYGPTNSYGNTLNQSNVECTASSQPAFCPNYQIAAMLSGLAPSTTYHIQMQASVNGVTWGSSPDTTFTTTALPATHPAYPVPPATFDATTPTTFAVSLTVGVSPGCSTYQACLNTATNERYTAGGNIVIYPGNVNVGSAIIQPPVDPNAAPFTPSNINTTANTITLTTPPYGSLAANQGIRFALGGSISSYCGSFCLPGWNAALAFPQGTSNSLVTGQLYYVINPSSGCTTNGASCTFQIALTPSGSPISFGTQGVGTNYVTLSPPASRNAIVIRTSTPDSQFCPPGTFCQGSIWSSRMAKLTVTGGLWAPGGEPNGPLLFQSNIGSHDYYFVGLEMTQTDASSLANTSLDPQPTHSLIYLNVFDAPYQIVFDRNYIHGLGFPNRIYSPMPGLDGANIAKLGNDEELWDYWRPWSDSGTPLIAGFSDTISGMRVTTANGSTFYGGPGLGAAGACTSNNLSITFTGGTVTGQAVKYFALSPTCTPTFVIPTGETATCAGTGSDGANTRSCVVTTAASPSFPVDANGSPWGGSAALTTITLTAGVPTASSAVTGGTTYPSIYDSEGTQGLIAGWGPGPFQFVNNTVSGAGLLWHFDESASSVAHPGDYVIQRNRFSAVGYQTGTATNYDYVERNPLEWKNGSRALVDGNTWTGGFAAVSLDDSMFTVTPLNNATITDFEVRNNTQNGGNFFITLIGGLMIEGQQAPQPFLRGWVHNNLINSPNGYTNFSPVNRGTGGDYAFYYGYAMEDIRTEHNTVYNPLGPDPVFMHWLGQPEEGQTLMNNLLFFSNDNGKWGMGAESISSLAANSPNCGSVIAVSLTNACMLQGSTPFWLTGGNVLVPLYNSTDPPTGVISASTTCTTEWGGSSFTAPNSCTGAFMAGSNSGVNYLEGDTTTAARLAGIGLTNPGSGIFSLASGSNWKGMATDSTDPGVAWSTLQNAQGVVQSVTVSGITTTAATVTVVAPDVFGCDIDVGSPGFTTTFTRFTQAGGSTMQVTNLTGLPPGARLQARVDCAAQQPTVNFSTASLTSGGFVAPAGAVFPAGFVP